MDKLHRSRIFFQVLVFDEFAAFLDDFVSICRIFHR